MTEKSAFELSAGFQAHRGAVCLPIMSASTQQAGRRRQAILYWQWPRAPKPLKTRGSTGNLPNLQLICNTIQTCRSSQLVARQEVLVVLENSLCLSARKLPGKIVHESARSIFRCRVFQHDILKACVPAMGSGGRLSILSGIPAFKPGQLGRTEHNCI